MGSNSISRELATFVHNISFENLPKEIVDRAKSLILDVLATAVAGRDMPYPKMAFRTVNKNRGNATVITYKDRLNPMDSAFVNSIMASAIGQDDMLYRFHPGAVIIPAVIAIAEETNGDGAKLIAALVAGYEIMGRLFLAAPHIVPRFRGVSVFGPVGASAACGKLLGLNEDQLISALGYASNLSSGLTECWIAGTMEGKFQNGFASRNGILSAFLAGEGAIAAENTFEGKAGFYQAFAGSAPDVNSIRDGLGTRFSIMDAECKLYPVCGLEQLPVHLALKLMEQKSISSRTIKNVTVVMPAEEYSYPGTNFSGPFKSRFQAIMSAQFCVAAALLGNPVNSYTFFDQKYGDEKIFEFAKKIELKGEETNNKIRIEIVLNDGSLHKIEGEKDDIMIPNMHKSTVKFRNLATNYFGGKKANTIINIVLDLDRVESINELTRYLICN